MFHLTNWSGQIRICRPLTVNDPSMYIQPLPGGSGQFLSTDSHAQFVYSTGNLAHTKGKGINTMRSPRTPSRTITFAKVLTAISALLLYYLPHEDLIKLFNLFFSSYCQNSKLLLNYNQAPFVFWMCLTYFYIDYSFSFSNLLCLLFSLSLHFCCKRWECFLYTIPFLSVR